MAIDPSKTPIYHITDIANLESIIQNGGLHSDVALAQARVEPTNIGHANIKWRRMHVNKVQCCGDRFVGEFVPFYFCPRSPMLYTVNNGNTGRPVGCQTGILHLVSDVLRGSSLGRQWAVSDGNAGSAYPTFSNAPGVLDTVNWAIIKSNQWAGPRMNAKQTEFLVADFYPITSFTSIGCNTEQTAATTRAILFQHGIQIEVNVLPHWYY
ncbi:hypothetical protein JAB8_51030 [Janthinobacterium sp. HH106]|nr:hypothetical protein JAB8_51030 [Janthinobacterium sp. HH106]